MQVALFAIGASIPLVVGSVVGALWKPPQRVLATALAFAAGALISAVAFDLFQDSYRGSGAVTAGLWFAAGAVVFVVIDNLLERWTGRGGDAVAFALLAGVTLDGVPENTALGVTLTHGGSIALLAAIFASNFPESMGGAVKMRQAGHSRLFAVGIWTGAAVLLGVAVVAGYALFAGASQSQLAAPLAFAGGAVLASVIDTVAPEAYQEGGPFVALASVAGFFMTFVLSH